MGHYRGIAGSEGEREMKVHCDHPTQHSACGAPSFVAVLREEPFRLEVRANRVLAAKDAGRRIYSGYDDGNGDTGARVARKP